MSSKAGKIGGRLVGSIRSFLKEHKALPIFILLTIGLTFGFSRLVLADTVTVKHIDENSNEQSLTLNKGTTIYLDPNFGYFKKDNDKRTKKLTLTNNLDLTNNDDINTNQYVVSKQNDPKDYMFVWGKNTTFSSIRTMQEMNSTICKAETTPTKDAVNTTIAHSTNTNLVPEARLKDTRDNKYYTVRKLADGNCWMTDNLAYAKAGTLKPSDSDVQDESFSLASSDIYTKKVGKWKYDEGRKFIFDRSFTIKGWRKSRLSNGNISLKAIYNLEKFYGNLYSWYTATAGTDIYSMGNDETASPSICPRGWRLPLDDGIKSYKNLLFTSYGLKNDSASSTKMQGSPLAFSFAGFYDYFNMQRVYGTGDLGNYWTYIVNFGGTVYFLSFSSSYVNLQDSNYMVYGASVRCVAR